MNIHEPQQARSRQTQERLLQALETLLEQKFFEQITIREIAKTAGLAPASVYRRFDNKEAMLPILYSRFDARLDEWEKGVWTKKTLKEKATLSSRVEHLVAAHVQFYMENQPIIRTLYLYIRLNGNLLFKPFEDKRKHIYERLITPLWQLDPHKSPGEDALQKSKVFALLLIAAVNERCLFGEYNPAAIIGLDLEEFSNELSKTLTAYLKS